MIKKLELTETEIEVVLKACKKYRSTIPGYIKSKQAEIDILDDLVQKLLKLV